jgi:hypothetical protein
MVTIPAMIPTTALPVRRYSFSTGKKLALAPPIEVEAAKINGVIFTADFCFALITRFHEGGGVIGRQG